MAKRPHRIVIRTTQEHVDELRSLAREKEISVSELIRKLIRKGVKTWKASVFDWIPDHDLADNKTSQLQLRMPDRLFRTLETVIDDLEYTRTDLYLRFIEMGRESDVEAR